jgi:tetratricopeptide (TPR) repeat protein
MEACAPGGEMGFLDGIFGGSRRRTAVRLAIAAAGEAGGLDAALSALAPLAARERAQALCELADHLRREDALDPARTALTHALELDPECRGAIERLATVESERGDLEAALAASARLVELVPGAIEPIYNHAGLLLAAGRPAEALAAVEAGPHVGEAAVALKRGEALLALDRKEEALALLDAVRDHYGRELRAGLVSRDDWQHLRDLHEEASRLADSARAELHGRETLVIQPALAGKLDGRAGVNYRLLGESLMVNAPPLADGSTPLEQVEVATARADRLLESDPKSAHALCLKGSALLRLGKLDAARDRFERAAALDGRCFAAFLGLGAVLDHVRYGLQRAAEGLPDLPVPEGLDAIVPDLRALTPLERRVVCASAAPLAGALPAIIAAGARIRLLPIDVRSTDLPELALANRGRTDDHRSYEAIGGLAAPRLAIARIDELLDVVSDHGLVFAHELAHLAFFHLSGKLRTQVEALYREASELGWVADAYALKNPDEFFAVSYTDWLRVRFGLPLRREPDEAGIFDRLSAVIEVLEGRARE